MIGLQTLADNLQTKLNKKKSGFTFKVFADTGNYEKPERDYNEVKEPINCILRLASSDVSNLVSGDNAEGLMLATLNVSFSLIYSLKGRPQTFYILSNGERVEDISDLPEDVTILETIEGYLNKVEDLRNALDNIFQSAENKVLTDTNGKTYNVGITYQTVGSGIREQMQGVGDSFVFNASIYYMFVQNGVNSRDVTFTLDGITFPYQRSTINRTPTLDGNVYANASTPSVKNIAPQTSLNMSFFVPATENGVTNNFVDYLLDGEPNKAHFLTANINGREKTYLVTIAGIDYITETIQNAGINITFLESISIYDLIYFGDMYYIKQCAVNSGAMAFETPTPIYLASTGEISVVSEITGVQKGDIIVSLINGTGAGFTTIQEPV